MRDENILMELENSLEEREGILTIPSPPRRAGSLNKSRSIAFGGALPVHAGISWDWMMSSSGCNRWPMLEVTLERYVITGVAEAIYERSGLIN